MSAMTLDPPTRADDRAACQAALAHGSRSFWAASLLLPARVREPAAALYAFCRAADDAIDEASGGQAALDALRAALDRAYAGRPGPDATERAFAAAVRLAGIPRALPEALIEGLAWDAEGRRYDTLTELEAYAARVAGAVGAMMALAMGARTPEALARACELGLAMQYSNIARDVGADAAAGRLYLPRDWLSEAGLDRDRPTPGPALAATVARLLAVADAHYARADAGIAALPADCRPGIAAARLLYAEIGHEVLRRGPEALHARAVVPRRRKLALVAQAFARAGRRSGPELAAPPPPETRFLVEAAIAAPPPIAGADGLVWVIGLFERLERRARLMRTERETAWRTSLSA